MVADVDETITLRKIEGLLAQFRETSLNQFVRDDRVGAVSNLAFPVSSVSITNTAALYRATRRYPQYAKGIVEADDWMRGLLRGNIDAQVGSLSTARVSEEPEKGEQLLLHLFWTSEAGATISPKVEQWLQTYCRNWIARSWFRPPSTLILYFADRVFGASNPTWSPETAKVVQAVAEQLVWRQVAFGAAGLWAHYDPVELVLALYLSYTTSFPAEVLAKATSQLNEVAHREQTWISRKPTWSSFYACHALLSKTHAGARLRALLRPAIVSHLNWLIDAEPREGTVWRAPDLKDRHPSAETWFNCLALEVLVEASGWIRDFVRDDVISKYDGRQIQAKVPWDSLLLDKDDLGALTKAFVTPINRSSSEPLAFCTAILFGPPGCAFRSS